MEGLLHRLSNKLKRGCADTTSAANEQAASDHLFLPIMARYLAPGDVVFDIGAFDGTFSKQYRAAGYMVHAFEGSPSNAATFKATCATLDGVTLHEVALHETAKTCKTKFNDCRGTEHPEIEVHYVELDTYFREQKLPSPDWIKIDIEGMESVALKKMGNLIAKERPIFQVEVHNSPVFQKFKYTDYPSFVDVKEGGFDFGEFVKNGYAMFVIETDGRQTPVRKLRDRRSQYLFIPNEKQSQTL